MDILYVLILIASFGYSQGFMIASNYTELALAKAHRMNGRSFFGVGTTTAAPEAEFDLIITGIADREVIGGDLLELYAVRDIPDISEYGFGIANNGGGSNGIQFNFPPSSYSAGDFIYVSLRGGTSADLSFFGVAADYYHDCCGFVSGADAVELYQNDVVIDVFGEISIDGGGTAFDYDEGWAYRVNGAHQSTTFAIGDWIFSGTKVLTGMPSNDASSSPMPLGSYTP